jgi:hypothetical protein
MGIRGQGKQKRRQEFFFERMALQSNFLNIGLAWKSISRVTTRSAQEKSLIEWQALLTRCCRLPRGRGLTLATASHRLADAQILL